MATTNSTAPPRAPGSCEATGSEKNVSNFSLAVVVMQTCIMLVSIRVLQVPLKRIGQPQIVAEILAGIILGPSGFGNFGLSDLFRPENMQVVGLLSWAGLSFYTFLIGLNMDPWAPWSSGKRVGAIAFAGAAATSILSLAVTPILMNVTGHTLPYAPVALILAIAMSNTASQTLSSLTTQLKLGESAVGRLATQAGLANDTAFLMLVSVASAAYPPRGGGMIESAQRLAAMVGFVALMQYLVGPLVRWMNGRNPEGVPVNRAHVGGVVLGILVITTLCSYWGYNSTLAGFMIGLLFPSEGRLSRVLADRIGYVVYTYGIPLFFCYSGQLTDLKWMKSPEPWEVFAVVFWVGTLGKIVGTLGAAHLLRMPMLEALALSFLMNVKGHLHFIALNMGVASGHLSHSNFVALILCILLTIGIVPPLVNLIVKHARQVAHYRHTALQWQKPGSELRVLACVHGPRNVPASINLLEASRGGPASKTPISIYAMQLVPITDRCAFPQAKPEATPADEARDRSEQIGVAFNAYERASGVVVRHLTAVSTFSTMHEDIRNNAQDVRASIIILPFHKDQCVDGRMEVSTQGFQTVNQKVLRHSPCSVGVLVDRGLGGTTQISATHVSHHVAVLFFGGPDDREALAFGIRVAEHPGVSFNLVRFLERKPVGSQRSFDEKASLEREDLDDLSEQEKERHLDEQFLVEFDERYVTPGRVAYVEKIVSNGAETVAELRALEGMYNLFIVGKGRRSMSPLTSGMTDWEECPEIGPVGDLLSSSDFSVTASVLVVQQYRRSPTAKVDDEYVLV
ncbi:hypothetical protein AMTRI_Chr02g222120 [Amborella trichopoda]|uniref:Uncharacterized protein n=1 Tax=Amborella trichopoda TaxID=13333 RepID=U5D674_AMBTC|nr:cation/H(+) antiporter 15 [Amborella trichopoda]ERN16927.1 hypothetical protein AMTR_s00057p00181590 [Amborella trichopoda]|eukprot:XP_006855460.1 cation/H(+) antiporter 15 [Amborella trichopoda]